MSLIERYSVPIAFFVLGLGSLLKFFLSIIAKTSGPNPITSKMRLLVATDVIDEVANGFHEIAARVVLEAIPTFNTLYNMYLRKAL